ncbi:MAG TPA: PKD domain-containing protein [Candidatus Angelobacter sp.]
MHGQRPIRVILFVVAAATSGFAGTNFQATTTLTAETTNNTSTANTFTTQTNGNLGATNVSKVSTRSLLYSGSTAKIYAHLVVWFGFGTNMDVGYTSSDPTQAHNQVTDMISRGIQGTIIDWYGQGKLNPSFVNYDQATQAVMQESQQHANFNFAIMDDGGSLKTCSQTTGCDVTQTLISDLTYAYNTYETSSAYLYFNNRPVVYFFGMEFYSIDWNKVRNSVPGNPLFIFRNTEGFSDAQSNGAFAWVDPENVSSTDPMALNYMGTFDSEALSLLPTYSNVAGFKGFNDSLASWGSNRLIAQQCGQTWLQSVALANNYFSTSQQMLGIQLVTWNDYEEGTEIESGIDNCATIGASVKGTVVSWSITGQSNTLDHYTVFLSQDGQNLMWLADVPTTTSSLDLAQFNMNAASYIVFVKAVGKPSIANKMSSGVSVTIGTPTDLPPVAALSVTPISGYGPLTITASTSGSYDPDGTIASSTINLGDGTTAAGPNASHTYANAGTYVVTATVTDNAGLASSATTTVTVSAPQVIVSSPANGITTTSPVHVVATGYSGYPVTAMQIYLDYNLIYTIQSPNLDTSVTMATGSHLLVVKGWDSSGRNFMTSLNITIANSSLSAALSVSPASILVGGSVTATTAGSTGSITSTQINFGDGAIVNAATATHQYIAAGTYTVTATVMNSTGASSTASAAVTVNPQYVAISSPASGKVGATVQVVATANSGYPITVTQVFLDGALKFQTSSSTVNTTLSIRRGTHQIVVQGTDSSGATFNASVTVFR